MNTFEFMPPLEYFDEYRLDPKDRSFSCETTSGFNAFLPCMEIEKDLVSHPNIFFTNYYGEQTPHNSAAVTEYARKLVRELGLNRFVVRVPPIELVGALSWPTPDEFNGRTSTSVVNLADYHVSNRRQRQISQANRSGFSYGQVPSGRLSESWGLMESFLSSRKLKSIGLNRINFLISKIPDFFQLRYVLSHQGEIAAVAFVTQFGKILRVPNYFGNRNYPGSIDKLLNDLIIEAQSNNFRYVDLGSSTDPNTGLEVDGILKFKSEFSAKSIKIYDYVYY